MHGAPGNSHYLVVIPTWGQGTYISQEVQYDHAPMVFHQASHQLASSWVPVWTFESSSSSTHGMTENGGGDGIWQGLFHVRFSSRDHPLLSYGQSFLAGAGRLSVPLKSYYSQLWVYSLWREFPDTVLKDEGHGFPPPPPPRV